MLVNKVDSGGGCVRLHCHSEPTDTACKVHTAGPHLFFVGIELVADGADAKLECLALLVCVKQHAWGQVPGARSNDQNNHSTRWDIQGIQLCCWV